MAALLESGASAAGQMRDDASTKLSPAEVAVVAAARPQGPLGPPRLFPALRAARTTLPAAARAGTIEETVDQCVVADMATLHTPGAQVAVVIEGRLAYQRGYGLRHRQNGGDVDARTIFRAGSLTKQFTAAAVLQQVEAGRLALDEPITRYIPELHLSGPWAANSITTRNVLSHTSGFPDNWEEIDGSREDGALAAWAAQQGGVKLHAPPGSFWNYTNPGYMLAGLAAERASGVPFRTYTEAEVFAPAGMTSTTFSPSTVQSSGNFAYGHFRATAFGRETIFTPIAYDSAAAAPAGYAFSTAGDLVHWASLLMEGGGGVLSPAAAEELQGAQAYMDYIPGLYYGYGVMRQDYKGMDIVWHDGSIPGWGSVLLWAPERRFAVALLANTSEPLFNAMFCIVDAVLQPENVTPPDYTTDPATWRRYVGTYALTDSAGSAYEAQVTLNGDAMSVTVTDIDRPGAPYTTPLLQAYLDTFVLDGDGDEVIDMEFTFVRSAQVTARTRWMRSRYVVGERSNAPRRTLP